MGGQEGTGGGGGGGGRHGVPHWESEGSFLGMAQQLDEPLDTHIPEAFVAAEPIVRARERLRVYAAVVDAASHCASHETGTLEGPDVLRRRRERHLMRRRELADGLLAGGEPLEHRASCVVAERAEDQVEPCLMMFNHEVERTARLVFVNRWVECHPQDDQCPLPALPHLRDVHVDRCRAGRETRPPGSQGGAPGDGGRAGETPCACADPFSRESLPLPFKIGTVGRGCGHDLAT